MLWHLEALSVGGRGYLSGREAQGEHPCPAAGGDVVGAVHRVADPLFHRCLVQGQRHHDGGCELLAVVRSQRRRSSGYDGVDDEVERAGLLDWVVHEPAPAKDHRGSVVHRVVKGRPGQHEAVELRHRHTDV